MHIFICPNLITLTITESIIQHDNIENYKIIFWPDRIDKKIAHGNKYIPITSKIKLLKLLLRSFFFRNFYVYIPHKKVGSIINFLISLSRRISIIDDGLDTFRENPRNINPLDFPRKTKYYTFDYTFEIADWVTRFEAIKYAKQFSICKFTNDKFNLEEFDTVVIESPPKVSISLLEDEKKFGPILLVTHPNSTKNTTTSDYINSNCIKHVKGNQASIELSILNYKGRIICGESMASLFSLIHSPPECYIILLIRKSETNNLNKLISIAQNRKNTLIMEINDE